MWPTTRNLCIRLPALVVGACSFCNVMLARETDTLGTAKKAWGVMRTLIEAPFGAEWRSHRLRSAVRQTAAQACPTGRTHPPRKRPGERRTARWSPSACAHVPALRVAAWQQLDLVVKDGVRRGTPTARAGPVDTTGFWCVTLGRAASYAISSTRPTAYERRTWKNRETGGVRSPPPWDEALDLRGEAASRSSCDVHGGESLAATFRVLALQNEVHLNPVPEAWRAFDCSKRNNEGTDAGAGCDHAPHGRRSGDQALVSGAMTNSIEDVTAKAEVINMRVGCEPRGGPNPVIGNAANSARAVERGCRAPRGRPATNRAGRAMPTII